MVCIPFLGGRGRSRSWLAGVFLLSASGCAASGPRAPSQASTVAGPRFATQGAAPARVDSALELAAPVLRRAVYVRAVLARNPTLESARQGVRAAQFRAQQAGLLDEPMLDVGVAPLSIGSSQARFGYEVGISQRLPWFGKRGLENAAAAAEAEASSSDYEATKRELALSAVMLYDQYFVAVRAMDINLHHVQLMRSMRDAVTAQFETGRASAQDRLQAEAELAHMEHDTAILSTAREVTVAQLNELLHRAPELPLPAPELPAANASTESGQREPRTLAERSEVSAALQRARAARARAERAARDRYPDLTLSTSYNSMWDMPEHRWMVGLGFNLPLQTGRRAAAADEARAMGAEFESDAARLIDATRTQVFVARKRVRESEHVLTIFEERLLPIAREQVDAARAGFTASQTPFTTLVAAEKDLRKVELDYETARADCDRHRAELERALGLIPGLQEAETGR